MGDELILDYRHRFIDWLVRSDEEFDEKNDDQYQRLSHDSDESIEVSASWHEPFRIVIDATSWLQYFPRYLRDFDDLIEIFVFLTVEIEECAYSGLGTTGDPFELRFSSHGFRKFSL